VHPLDGAPRSVIVDGPRPGGYGARPTAIVLSTTMTGLATVRALAHAGVEVHAFLFDPKDHLRYSRYARKVYLDARAEDEEWLAQFLVVYARTLGGRPVVLPTSDALALFLARYRDRLSTACRLSETSFDELSEIINKDGLIQRARTAGVPCIDALDNATAAELQAFTREHAGPYLLKPVFTNSPHSVLRTKNVTLPDRAALHAFADEHGLSGVIVQPFVRGGDGEIYDTYGLCASDGRLITIATHRRIRQYPRDRGTTTFGAIPSGLFERDWILVNQTRRLLSTIQFHGIFGIEWLHDVARDAYCLIDFNARPFSSIGHLEACGLNLPHLAWRELAGHDLSDVDVAPQLRPSIWVDFKRDLARWRESPPSEREPLGEWARSLLQARSFAYFELTDPGPFARRVLNTLPAASSAWRRVKASARANGK
jgi:predicted ATP-grasp superfamily ATP-dependent carboligase